MQIMNVARQSGGSDCGRLTNATALLYETDPCNLVFDQQLMRHYQLMRHHIIKCMEGQKLRQFPSGSYRCNKVYFTFSVFIFPPRCRFYHINKLVIYILFQYISFRFPFTFELFVF